MISKSSSYISRDTCEATRDKKPIIDWWKLIWFSFAIPKHAFVLWLAVRNYLSTGDRMLKWGYKGEVKCLFCKNIIECRDHLFFNCGFSKRIWREVMKKCLLPNIPTVWEEIMSQGIRE